MHPLEARVAGLQALGFSDTAAIMEPLDLLRDTSYYRRLDETGRRRLHELLGRLLPPIAQTRSPATTLVRVLKIVERIGGRTVYLALLNENAAARRRLVSLCEQSQFLTDQIAAQPLLLDELIDERLIEETPTRAQFAEDLALRRRTMQDEEPERQVELLREFQSAALFRVAVADLIGGLPLMKVSDRLTDIAELIVEETLGLAPLADRSQARAHRVTRMQAEQSTSRT
jgi:glutamate-ammonia-ligase adenylyltransferase